MNNSIDDDDDDDDYDGSVFSSFDFLFYLCLIGWKSPCMKVPNSP